MQTPSSVPRLQDLRSMLTKDSPHTLAEILPEVELDRVRRLFPCEQNFGFKIDQPPEDQWEGGPLSFEATFASLLPWQNVQVHINLFDLGETRHTLFYFCAPDTSPSAKMLLNQYSSEPSLPLPPEAWAPYSPVCEWIKELDFIPGKWFIYSSLDYSALDGADAQSAYYPVDINGLMVRESVHAGFNFIASADIGDGLCDLLTGQIGGTAAGLSVESRGLLYIADAGLAFKLCHPAIKLEKTFGELTLALTELDLVLRLETGSDIWPETTLVGQVKIGKLNPIEIIADFNPYTKTLGLAIRNFPSLLDLLEMGGASDFLESFPAPLHSLLHLEIEELSLLLWLSAESLADAVLGIGLRVSTDQPVKLIEFSSGSDIAIQPTLTLGIQAPFNPEARAITGSITGLWEVSGTKFLTSLSIPRYDFYIGLIEEAGNELHVDAWLKPILPPGFPEIQITELEFSGNFLSKSVTARLKVSGVGTWRITITDHDYELEELGMDIVFTGGEFVSCDLVCELDLAGTKFVLSGQYDTTQGLSIAGRTAEDSTMDAGAFVNTLAKGLALPEGCPALPLTNVSFSAIPKSSEYSFSAQTAGAWPLAQSLRIKVDQFSFNTSRGIAISGQLVSAGDSKTEGATDQIPIDKLFTAMAQKFMPEQASAGTAVPGALQGLLIDHAAVTFSSTSQATTFMFTCEVKYPADNPTADMTLYVQYQGSKAEDGKASKYDVNSFGVLAIGGQVFRFDLVAADGGAASGEGDASSLLLLGTYQNKQPLELGDLLAGIGADVRLNLSLDIQNALFAYAREGDQPGRYLFGLTLSASFDLASLPDLAFFSGGLRPLGVQNMSILYANQQLSRSQVSTINAQLQKAQIPQLPMLPAPAQAEAVLDKDQAAPEKSTEPPGMNAGLNLTALLALPGGQVSIVAPRPKEQPNLPQGDASQPASQLLATSGAITTQLKSKAPTPAKSIDATWFDIKKALGPLYIDKLGVRYADDRLWLLLSAGLHTGLLTLDIIGLGLAFDVKNLGFDAAKWLPVDFTLNGLSLNFQSGSVSVTGILLRGEGAVYGPDGQALKNADGTTQKITQYSGEVHIALPGFSILGVGAYSKLNNGDPALFLYAALSFTGGGGIGSPPVVITGLALGFGLNYRVEIPPIDKVASFPLVQIVMGSGGEEGQPSAVQAAQEGPGAVLATLVGGDQPSLKPMPGQYFGALGLRFTLFQMIDAFGLAIVQLGAGTNDLEINLLGLARFKKPEEGKAICYIELALLVNIQPSLGILRIEAQLTSNSWLFDSSCRLTGGFALAVWFAGEHGGDFVLSIGGYHPRFPVPAYYPIVPRVGLNMQVGSLAVKGEAYLAVTPALIMGGGKLEASFTADRIAASFTLYMDFIVQWEPLHYTMNAGIAIHVTYDLGITPLAMSLVVDLHVEGPPFHGSANINLGVVSFTLSFGEASEVPERIDWDHFATSFLGLPQPAQAEAGKSRSTSEQEADDRPPVPVIHQINVVAGQVLRPATPDQPVEVGKDKACLVRADELVFAVSSVVPATTLVLGQVNPDDLNSISNWEDGGGVQKEVSRQFIDPSGAAPKVEGSPLGIRPMGVKKLDSPLLVSIVDEKTRKSVDGLSGWRLEESHSAMPTAVWGAEPLKDEDLLNAKAFTMPNCVTGVRRLCPPSGGPRGQNIIGVSARAFDYLPVDIPKQVTQQLESQPVPGLSSDHSIPQVVGDAGLRQGILQALVTAGFAEFDHFDPQPVISRPLQSVPMSSSMRLVHALKEDT